MTSSADRGRFVRAARAALAAAAALAATVALARADDAATLPAGVAARIAAALAPAWNADPARVQVTCTPGALDAVGEGDALSVHGRGDDGWYVVVAHGAGYGTRAVRVRAGLADSAAFTTRALVPGDTLKAADLRLAAAVLWGGPRAVLRPGQGWIARRPLAVGDRLAPPNVTPPDLIAPGQAVHVTFERGDVKLSLDGVAVSRAGRGERVRVRVPGRAAPLSAIACAAGEARLDGGARP